MTDRSLLEPRQGGDGARPPDAGEPSGSESEPAWLVGFGPVPSEYARTLILDAPDDTPRWIRRLFRSPETGQLAAMELRRRLFTPAQRHFVRLRDQWCRTPYCGAPIRHTDHVVPAKDGGTTSVDNAQGLCEACNYVKQVPGWHTDLQPDGTITVRTPGARRYDSARPAPPGPPAPTTRPTRRRTSLRTTERRLMPADYRFGPALVNVAITPGFDPRAA
jgi:hypothetical protein